MAIPRARPSRAVTAVDLSVLLKRGHHGGLGVARRLGMVTSVAWIGDDRAYGMPTSLRQAYPYQPNSYVSTQAMRRIRRIARYISAAARTTKMPVSMPWNVQKRSAG